MKIYRVAKGKYIDDLSGEGAKLYGGRWNKEGDAMLYFSENLSLCILEILVHMDYQYFTEAYRYIEIEISENLITSLKKPEAVSKQWRTNPPLSKTQEYGSSWIHMKSSLALAVPSAVLPLQRNILINPSHPDISKIKVGQGKILELDSRMYL